MKNRLAPRNYNKNENMLIATLKNKRNEPFLNENRINDEINTGL